MEFPAGEIEGALLLLGIDAIEQRAALVIDPVVDHLQQGPTDPRMPAQEGRSARRVGCPCLRLCGVTGACFDGAGPGRRG